MLRSFTRSLSSPLIKYVFFSSTAVALIYCALRLSASTPQAHDPVVGKQPNGSYLVPTDQILTPAGSEVTFEGRPDDIALSPDGATLAVMSQDGLRLFDTHANRFKPEILRQSFNFGGLAWSHDGSTLYASGRSRIHPGDKQDEGVVFVIRVGSDGGLQMPAPIPFALNSRIQPNTRAGDSGPCGLALSPDQKTLYVTLFNNCTLASVDLTGYDPATGAAPTVETPVGSSPERVLVSPSGDRVYVADRGGRAPRAGDTMDIGDPVVVDPDTYKAATGAVTVLQTADLGAAAKTRTIDVGLQPADMALSQDGARLFVASANADTISVIDTAAGSVQELIPTSPAPGRLGESSPNGLAISPDGRTLYVTLGGDNAVEVVRLGRAAGGTGDASKIEGLIPTEWFPLHVTLSADGKTIYEANSKGVGSLGPLVTHPLSMGATVPQQGPGGAVTPRTLTGHSVYSVEGSIGVITVPGSSELRRYTRQVAQNNHFDRMQAAITQQPDPFWSRFKHAILIIKENRTYDQILGDIKVPAGHIGGDPGLVMFGEKITPNQHAIARRFGIFDNTYCSGEISADGHHWVNEAFADDYDERALDDYPRSYPCCGTDPLSFAGNSFLWQAAMAAGCSYRNYGEYGPLPSIRRHSNLAYNSRFEVTADRNEDVAHCDRILADLRSKPLARFTTIWFPNNHTSGLRPGAYSPESDIADN
ncbi:MAG TPA: YncE family protein, partial [Chthonomonadales bacterium]|nr:YncE family protein [Chthonomonadales bacterium]